jgi:hypothetical protein
MANSTSRLKGRAVARKSKPKTNAKTKADAQVSRKTKGAPKSLGARGNSSKPASATKPKSVVKKASSPNTKAVSTRRGKATTGKMTDVQKKSVQRRTKAKLKKNLKSPLKKAAKKIGGRLMSTAGLALSVAEERKRAVKKSRRRAAGIKDA